MNTPDEEELIPAGGVAALFGVDPKTVVRWAHAGVLPAAVRTPGGHRRWRRSEVLAARERFAAQGFGGRVPDARH